MTSGERHSIGGRVSPWDRSQPHTWLGWGWGPLPGSSAGQGRPCHFGGPQTMRWSLENPSSVRSVLGEGAWAYRSGLKGGGRGWPGIPAAELQGLTTHPLSCPQHAHFTMPATLCCVPALRARECTLRPGPRHSPGWMLGPAVHLTRKFPNFSCVAKVGWCVGCMLAACQRLLEGELTQGSGRQYKEAWST